MKKTVASIVLAIAAQAYAQTNAPIDNFTLVTNLWWNGHKTEVLQIAEQRLAANSNDLAGLILRMEFNIATNNIESFSNDIQSVLVNLPSKLGICFNANRVNIFRTDLECSLDYLATEFHPSANEILEDMAKFNIRHKSLIYAEELKALHDDGLF